MKKLFTLAIALILCSCSSSKVEEVAAFEFDNAWHWIVQYEDDATPEEIQAFVKKWANPEQTSFFYVYDKSVNLEIFKKEAFNQRKFAAIVLDNPPKQGIYKMPMDPVFHDDAVWLLEQSQKR